jgi:hypothetical protein
MPGLVPSIHVLCEPKTWMAGTSPAMTAQGRKHLMSELDKVFRELAQKRAQQDQERRERQKLAADFLSEFFETDIKPSQTLKSRGIQARFADNKLVLHKPQSGHYEEPLYVVVGEGGEIDIAGRSLGRYQPAEKLAKKRELIGEIISFFDL